MGKTGVDLCRYCYGKGFYFYYGKGIGNALGPCFHKPCPHCKEQHVDEPKEEPEKVVYGVEEDF